MKWPFITRKKYEDLEKMLISKNTQISELIISHKTELEEIKKILSKIIPHLSKLDWRRDSGDRYSLMISFDPQMIGHGFMDRKGLEIIAEYFSRYVENEILTCKFIQKATEFRELARGGF